MLSAEKSFISSTFWTERLGFVAGLETLKIMQEKKTWKIIVENGKYFNKKVQILAKKYNLKIKISGIQSITSFNFLYKKNYEYKKFISQEMLKKGYLASNQIFITIHHTKKIIDKYINKLDPVFKKINYLEKTILAQKNFLRIKFVIKHFKD